MPTMYISILLKRNSDMRPGTIVNFNLCLLHSRRLVRAYDPHPTFTLWDVLHPFVGNRKGGITLLAVVQRRKQICMK